jgi:hypothetical protein
MTAAQALLAVHDLRTLHRAAVLGAQADVPVARAAVQLRAQALHGAAGAQLDARRAALAVACFPEARYATG